VNSAQFPRRGPRRPARLAVGHRDRSVANPLVDSSGLGALFALYRATAQRNGVILRLLNPRPEIQQLLELTQMQQLFEIVRR